MSVINQMLRDLDKQQPAGNGPGAAARQSALTNSSAGTTFAASASGQQIWPWLLLGVCLLTGWLMWPLLQERLNVLQPVPVVAAAAVTTAAPTKVTAVQTEAIQPAAAQGETAQPEATQPESMPAEITQVKTPQVETAPAADQAAAVSPEPASLIINEAAPASDSEVFAAEPVIDLNEQPAAVSSHTSKAASSMQIETIQQDPKQREAEQMREQLSQQVQQQLQLARQTSQQQQWQQTLHLLQQIPPEFSSADLWQLQANARQQLGDFPGALASWQQLLALKPQLAQAWLGKALAHDQLAQLPEARAAYQQAYELPGLSAASRQFIQQRLAQ